MRALLAQATLEERRITKENMKGDEGIKQILHAYSFIKRALDIITRPENKVKYQYLIYNASVTAWWIVRSALRSGWARGVVEILEKLSQLLEE